MVEVNTGGFPPAPTGYRWVVKEHDRIWDPWRFKHGYVIVGMTNLKWTTGLYSTDPQVGWVKPNREAILKAAEKVLRKHHKQQKPLSARAQARVDRKKAKLDKWAEKYHAKEERIKRNAESINGHLLGSYPPKRLP